MPLTSSQKARLRDFSEQTPLKIYLKNSSKLLNHANVKEVIPRILFKGHSEMQLKNRKLELLQTPQESKRILPFVTQYHPAVTNLKQILMKDWQLIERQPLLKEIYKTRPSFYKRGRSIKDILVRAKLQNSKAKTRPRESCRPVTPVHLNFRSFPSLPLAVRNRGSRGFKVTISQIPLRNNAKSRVLSINAISNPDPIYISLGSQIPGSKKAESRIPKTLLGTLL